MNDLQQLYRIALTWADGNPNRAAVLVVSYCAGQTVRSILESVTA